MPELRESRAEFSHANWWALLTALGWLAFAALTLLVPPTLGHLASAAYMLSVGLGMLLLLTVLLVAERPRWSVTVRSAMFLTGVAIVLAAYFLNVKGPWLKCVIGLALMALAMPVGYWIGERMEKVTNLIPLAIAMSLADIFSVFQGPTKKIAEDLTTHYEKVAAVSAKGGTEAAKVIAEMKAPLADYIIVHFPIAGQHMTYPILGIGDFVVLAFLFRAAWIHHISPWLILWSSAISIFVALVATTVLGIPLPALPFIALGTISVLWLCLPRIRKLDRQEVVLSFAVVGVFGALITGKYFSSLF
jgi:hypothetical protein